MGLIPVHPNPSYAVNSKVFIMLLLIAVYMISSLVFILFEAKYPLDFGNASFEFIAQIVAMVSCANLIWKMSEILLLFRHCEQFIEKRKFRRLFWNHIFPNWNGILEPESDDLIAKYQQMSEMIERMSQLCYVFGTQVTVFIVSAPPLTETILNHLGFDCVDTSYKLLSPILYVKNKRIHKKWNTFSSISHFSFVEDYHSVGRHHSDTCLLLSLKFMQWKVIC